MKRQYDKCLYRVGMKQGFIRVGYIYNKSKGNPQDVVSLAILNKSGDIMDINMRIDEAMLISAGLSHVCGLRELNEEKL